MDELREMPRRQLSAANGAAAKLSGADEQAEKLKNELDLIYDAINRTKREIAILHGKSFSGEEMAKVNGELGAVVGGTEEATQEILERRRRSTRPPARSQGESRAADHAPRRSRSG